MALQDQQRGVDDPTALDPRTLELQERERQYRLLTEHSSDVVALYDGELRLQYVSPSAFRLSGYTVDELLTYGSMDLVYPPDREGLRRSIAGALESRVEQDTMAFRFVHRDGRVFWVEMNSRRVFDAQGRLEHIVATTRDITARKQVEERLRESEARLASAMDIARLGHWELDVASGVFTFTDSLYAIYRTTADREGGYRMAASEYARRFVHPDDAGQVAEETRKAVETDDAGFTRYLEHRILYADGSVGHVSVRYFIEKDATGRTARTFGVNQDITERKLADEERRAVDRRLSLALRVARMGYWDWRVDTHHIEWFGESAALFGVPDGRFDGTLERLQSYVHPDDRAQGLEAYRRCIEEGQPFINTYRVVHPDGSIRWLHSLGELFRHPDGRPDHIFGVTLDITASKSAEEEHQRLSEKLQQAAKMEAIGRLAGGVAHDFNNMLAATLGYTEMALQRIADDDPLRTDLEEIRKAAERSADLTRQLLAFARRQTVAPKVIDLNATVEGMLKMLGRLMGEDVHLRWLPGEHVASVKIDPSQIDQILANLCVNARDAISGVGTVTIETGSASFGEDYCAGHPGFVPGLFVRLSVRDDGCGMDADTVGHLFEPFFTTKGLGKGTGLGLATVYGAVKQNDGFIAVESAPGQGTTFEIYLPRHESDGARGPDRTSSILERGSETVLVVEDELPVLRLTTMMLEGLGYDVLAARTPAEALALAQECGGRIRLLLTDVVMPGMNGKDLATQLHTMNPELKWLFMSGYTADVIAHRGVLDDGVAFIQKPFSMRNLGAKVREALEGRS